MLFRYVLLVALLHYQAYAQYGTDTGCLDANCTQRLDALLHRYEDATDSVGECDTSCLANCYQVLEEAIYSTSGRSCPPVEDISSCMNVYYAEWVDFVQECPLFTFKDDEAEAESEAPEAAESETESEAAESEAPEAAESEAESEAAESEAPEAAESETESEAAESEAPEAAESEAESEAAESEAESEAAESEAPEAAESEAESEGENDSEGEGECGGESSGGGEGEGEGSASGQGCFPEFANLEEFETYIQGAYYSSIWSKPSNTVGIILSVLFWVALGCMGVYLGRK